MGAKLAKGAQLIRSRSSKVAAPDHGDESFRDFGRQLPFGALYTMGPKLGSGTYATVHKCTYKLTGEERAVKVVYLEDLTHPEDKPALEEEIQILSKMKHKHIVRLFHVFRTEKRVYMVQELCAGGELFERIVEKHNYCENDARELMRRALEALAYAHSKGVVHRDLKPENVLLARPEDDVDLKLADFGMARSLTRRMDMLSTICGSPGYMAPEIVKQEPYDEKVDIWALATITFAVLGGYNPWDAASTPMVFAKIRRGTYRFDPRAFQAVSEDAKDLIKHMLVVDPAKRITAQAALHHKWFDVRAEELMRHDLSLTRQHLKEYRANARFRRAANAVVVLNRLKVLSSGRSLSRVVSRSSSSSLGSSSTLSTRSGSGGSVSGSEHGSASSPVLRERSGSGGSGSGLGESKHDADGATKGRGDSLDKSGRTDSGTSNAGIYGYGGAPSASGIGRSGGASGSGKEGDESDRKLHPQEEDEEEVKTDMKTWM